MQPNSFLLFPERHFETQDLATACVLKYRGFSLFATPRDPITPSIVHYVFKKKDGIESASNFNKQEFTNTTLESLREIAKELVARIKKN
jgi:hypothetical protein